MNDHRTLNRLRTFLRVLAAGMFGGTIVELLLAEHFDGPIQLVPFVLCGLGLMVLFVAWKRPSRRSVLALRMVMTVVAAGSLLGVAEHFWGNHEFARETRPEASELQLLLPSLTGGDPLLAPGILAVAAAVAIAATYAAGDSRADDRQPATESASAGAA